jgi:hypothetical protein
MDNGKNSKKFIMRYKKRNNNDSQEVFKTLLMAQFFLIPPMFRLSFLWFQLIGRRSPLPKGGGEIRR